ncbi:MAG: nitroreductase [Solobacterium sp.]|nr:nitroreductase [Solobacterium sp.]MBQ9823453.1 nitroreductase [Solobacterium sp.]
MAELNTVIRNRRSVRKYTEEKVSQDKVDEIIEAGLWAASGMGKQAPVILQIDDKETRDQIAKLNAAVMGRDMDPFYGAPQVLIVLADRSAATYLYDGALTMGNMMLKAYDLGVSSCWIHRAKEVFNTEEGKAILARAGIEGDYEGIGNLIIGYCDGELPPARERNQGRVYKI